METLTILAFIAIPTLIFSCCTAINRFVSSHISEIDLRKLKLLQLSNRRGDGNKVSIRAFLDNGPVEYQELLYKNVEIIEFHNRQFGIIKGMTEVLYVATIIWGIMIFARLSIYGLEVSSGDLTRTILDYFIGGYFIIWFYFLHKMRHAATDAKLDYDRFLT